jgi:hypothetical protein
MDKPELIESYQPHSGHYSWKKDLRLNAWLAVATALYVAIHLVVKHHSEWNPLLRGLLTLTPLLPGLLYLHSWARMVRALDELQRRIQIESCLFAALGTVILGTIVATLNASGLELGEWLRHGLGIGGVFMAMFALWLVGSAIANCRYK